MICVYVHPQSAWGRQTQFCDSKLQIFTGNTSGVWVDVIGTSPDSDGTTFINPILPLNGVPWLSPRVQDQELEVGKRPSLDNVTVAIRAKNGRTVLYDRSHQLGFSLRAKPRSLWRVDVQWKQKIGGLWTNVCSIIFKTELSEILLRILYNPGRLDGEGGE